MTSADLLATALDDPRARVAPGGLQAGAVFAGHHLIDELGRGGMGMVFTACHLASNRIVALKVPHASATPELLRRFRAEAEAAAALLHPGILAVHEVGEADGVPYFTMQFAECGSLSDRFATFARKPRAVAELVARIADAVQHAHAHGLLHRDLKPSNILLAAPEHPLVADFGLARWLARESDLTQSLTMLGTPDYMAPEAVRGARQALTTAADIFSLGAMLHHLLSGEPPFRGASVAETLQRVVSEAPRALDRTVPRDLAAICLKALEREPARRFASARELADDLRRFLRGEPILARHAPPLEKAWRWCRRRPGLAALLALLVVVLVVAFLLIDGARRAEAAAKTHAETASQQLREANTRIQDSLDLSELERAEDFFAAGDSAQGVALLARVARRHPMHPTAAQRLASALWQGDFILPRGAPFYVGGKIMRLQFLRDGATLLVATETGAGLWDAASGSQRVHFEHDGTRFFGTSLSNDEQVCAAWDYRDGKMFFLWDVATGRRLGPPVAHDFWMRTILLSPDGARFLPIGGEVPARLRDTRRGDLIGEPMPHPRALWSGAFSPDGTMLATSEGETVRLWESAGPQLLRTLSPFGAIVEWLQFTPDGRWLLVAGRDGNMRFYGARDGQPTGAPMRHEDSPSSFAFTADGARLVSASDDHTARVWSVPGGEPLAPPLRHRDAVPFATFSPDGGRVVTCSRDNTSRLWDAQTGRPLSQPLRTAEQSRIAAFAPDGATFYIGGVEGLVQRWDSRIPQPTPVLLDAQSRVRFAGFSEDGKRAVTAGADGRAVVWSAFPFKDSGLSVRHPGSMLITRFNASGERLVTGMETGSAWVHDLAPGGAAFGPFEHSSPLLDACLSPDGKTLAMASEDGSTHLWDVESRKLLAPPPPNARRVASVRFSPDGKTLLTASWDGTARLWSVATSRPVCDPLTHIDGILDAEFSPDGRLVATASLDNTARVWDAQSGLPLSLPMSHERTVSSVAFSPDSRQVVTASWDGTARVWDARTGRPITRAMAHDDHVTDAQFSPDGRRVATASRDKTARVWDAGTGLPITEPLRHPAAVERIRFHPDGRHLITTADIARVWEAPDFSAPPPPWLLDFAERIARGEPISRDQFTAPAVTRGNPTSPDDAFARLAQRFFGQ